MKQTPVQWLYDQIGDNAPHDYAAQIASYLEEAMKMEESQGITLQNESESKAIPELSDEEIIHKGIEHYKTKGYKFGQAKTEIWYMAIEWYREQLKQRQ